MPTKSKHASHEAEEYHSDECCDPRPNYGLKLLYTLIGILLVYGIVFLGTLIRNNLQKYNTIGRADRSERLITLDAQGKVSVKPDVAVTTMGMISEAPTVAEAQKKNTDVMNALIEKVKGLGVEPKDVQTTSYNVYPQYSYKDNDQVLKGYQVSQNVTVKIRNLDVANKILALAGEVGANNVNGLTFTVDDRDQFKDQARKQAMDKVFQKAQALSKDLGVRIVEVVNYSEYEADASGAAYKADGMGGLGAAPSTEAGNTDVIVNVNVTYEIR